MKNNFALALIASCSLAQYMPEDLASGGTTGHFGNQYGHGGEEDHSHQDHIYGYDSIPADWDLDSQAEIDLHAALVPLVEEANLVRTEYL